MTFRQRLDLYRSELAALPLSASERHAYYIDCRSYGPIPQHCGTCGKRSDEPHRDTCTAEAHPIAVLCDDCLHDISDEPHGAYCPQRLPKCGECGADAELDECHAVTCSVHPQFSEAHR